MIGKWAALDQAIGRCAGTSARLYIRPGRRSVAQPGRALLSGGRGRRFKSSHSDQFHQWLIGPPGARTAVRKCCVSADQPCRLCARYRRLAATGRPKVVVTTAIAREMVGFIWAIARLAQPALV